MDGTISFATIFYSDLQFTSQLLNLFFTIFPYLPPIELTWNNRFLSVDNLDYLLPKVSLVSIV